MVNHELTMYQEMLVVVFGVPSQIVRGFKRKDRKVVPHNFMTMRLWEVLTEQQFDALYNILHADGVASNESFELFVNSAVVMNEDLVREKNNRKRKEHYWKNPQAERERCKRYREKNKDKIRERDREYHHKNRDKILKKQKEYREKNKEEIKRKLKEYRERNKDKIRERDKEYYLKNRDKIRERDREYYLKNRDKILRRQKEYRKRKQEE